VQQKLKKIVTGGESVDDVYVGHVNIPSCLVIASDQCFWLIDRKKRKPWCLSWGEISHFALLKEGDMRVTYFSQTGIKSFIMSVSSSEVCDDLYQLLAMQIGKMGNSLSSNNFPDFESMMMFNGSLENISNHNLLGFKSKQSPHTFGSCNRPRFSLFRSVGDEMEIIERCYADIRALGSDQNKYFSKLDECMWSLVNAWGQIYTGLSSKRCVVAGMINGSGESIQIKTTKLVEGGSPCFVFPTKEYDQHNSNLGPGGSIILFGWGSVPSMNQSGKVFITLETSALVCDFSDRKSKSMRALALPGFRVGFLEKSYDESGWWAKYNVFVRKRIDSVA